MKLLAAYEEGDAEEVKRAAQSSTINHLDHVVCLFLTYKHELLNYIFVSTLPI
jgi:hypothetical protein